MMPGVPRSSIKLDIVTAYVAGATKVGAWAAVSALVFRNQYEAGLGVLSLLRSTVGILSYAAIGVGPAMVHLMGKMRNVPIVARAESLGGEGEIRGYESRLAKGSRAISANDVFKTGSYIAAFGAILGFGILLWLSDNYRLLFVAPRSQRLQEDMGFGFLLMGLGMLVRLLGDPVGARIQIAGMIWLDNVIAALGDVVFVFVALRGSVWSAAAGFFFSGVVITSLRWWIGRNKTDILEQSGHFMWSIAKEILSYGCGITLANLADFLYAPTDFILINNLINPATAGVYSPAVQIDAAMLLLVAGLASVIFPRAAVAHAGGNVTKLRDYYIRGTVASSVILLVAAILVWLASPAIFKVWLHDPMVATQAILPLVLIHTVIGGSSGIGRSILLAMGKVKPFTIAVLIAGTVNVILSFVFVKYLHLGLHGIILGTIVAVIGRCAIWMPWYVMRVLRSAGFQPARSN